MNANEIAAQIRDRAENISGLLGALDSALAGHADAIKQIPAAESRLMGLKSAVIEAENKLASLTAEYSAVKALYDDLAAKFHK